MVVCVWNGGLESHLGLGQMIMGPGHLTRRSLTPLGPHIARWCALVHFLVEREMMA